MQLSTYLSFNGQCEEAFQFYEQSIGGKIQSMIPHTGTPAENSVPTEWRHKIMHARLALGDSLLMGSDAPPDRYHKVKGACVHLSVQEPAEADRIFHALADQGTVQMPIQQTFWAERFGMLVDRFGTPWMVSCQGGVRYE